MTSETATVCGARILRWADLTTDHPMERIARRRVIGEQAMISEVRLDAGCHVPTHAHDNEQIVNVLEGELEFSIDGVTRVLGPGTVTIVPPNAVHSGVALSDCRVIDTFCPVQKTFALPGD